MHKLHHHAYCMAVQCCVNAFDGRQAYKSTLILEYQVFLKMNLYYMCNISKKCMREIGKFYKRALDFQSNWNKSLVNKATGRNVKASSFAGVNILYEDFFFFEVLILRWKPE